MFLKNQWILNPYVDFFTINFLFVNFNSIFMHLETACTCEMPTQCQGHWWRHRSGTLYCHLSQGSLSHRLGTQPLYWVCPFLTTFDWSSPLLHLQLFLRTVNPDKKHCLDSTLLLSGFLRLKNVHQPVIKQRLYLWWFLKVDVCTAGGRF